MSVQDTEILELKLVMLTAAVTEMARALSPRDAATVAGSLGQVLTQLLGEIRLAAHADEALATDLAPLMAALQRDTSATMDRASAGSDKPDHRWCVAYETAAGSSGLLVHRNADIVDTSPSPYLQQRS